MNRRAYLALLGGGLAGSAGCSALSDGSHSSETPTLTPVDPSTNDSNRRTTESGPITTGPTEGSMPLEPSQTWSLVEFETLPVTVSLTRTRWGTHDGGRMALEFTRSATVDGPAVLEGTFTNTNRYANTFDLLRLPLFGRKASAWPGGRPRDDRYTYRDVLVLAPTDSHALATHIPDLELAADGRWRLAGEVEEAPFFPRTVRLGPEETVRVGYALVGVQEGEGFPRERYHFPGYHETEVVIGVWRTDAPGPVGNSPFSGTELPSLPQATRMAWYHDAASSTDVYLEPDRERIDPPGRVMCTLVNHGREPLVGNPSFWRVWKHVDGQWFHVAPQLWPEPLTEVPPGGIQTWTLAAFSGHSLGLTDAYDLGYLGGGRYAFEVGISRENRTHAALIDLEGPPVSLEPTDGLTVTRDGAQATVRWPRRTDEVPRATLRLTRSDRAETQLITEQVMQHHNRGLRNSLPFLTDEETRVELSTDQNTVSAAVRTNGYDPGAFWFRYDGESYEATAEFDVEG